MTGYTLADVRFNNGNGALLCNRCQIIVDYGFEHEDRLHYCDKCLKTIADWPLHYAEDIKTKLALDELARQGQELGLE
jgi:hypothetical protein